MTGNWCLLREHEPTAPIIINSAQVLCSLERPDEALALLEQFKDSFVEDPNYLHHLATLAFQNQLTTQALHHFRMLLERCPQNRQYLGDAAQAFWVAGDRGQACELALSVLDRSVMPLPSTENDFYIDGLANYIRGDLQRARCDFVRSGRPEGDWYGCLLPG